MEPLEVLGATSLWPLRRVIDALEQAPDGFVLNRAQVNRLPSSLRSAHDEWTSNELHRHEAARATS